MTSNRKTDEKKKKRTSQTARNHPTPSTTTHERGRITAHAEPVTLHPKGITFVAQRIMPAKITTDNSIGNQNLFIPTKEPSVESKKMTSKAR
jgi:hypothetical protein